jgi:hypothetical protein
MDTPHRHGLRSGRRLLTWIGSRQANVYIRKAIGVTPTPVAMNLISANLNFLTNVRRNHNIAVCVESF